MPYLHHLLVPFPIAFAFATIAAVLIALRRSEGWAWLGRIAAITAVMGAALAAATGLFSAGHVIEMGGDPALIARHRNFALGATGLLAASALLIRFSKVRALGVAGAAVAVVAVSVAAHFGGDLLHPGLAPWSEAPHHHGPFSPAAHAEHAPPAGSEAGPPPTVAPPVVSSVAPQPSTRPKPVHDHSTHKH